MALMIVTKKKALHAKERVERGNACYNEPEISLVGLITQIKIKMVEEATIIISMPLNVIKPGVGKVTPNPIGLRRTSPPRISTL